MSRGSDSIMNRLKDATSPYLLQHADNPVDWWQWSDDAFEQARRRDLPFLLSVGYFACHWCHVMAHESFEDPATAALLNEHMVAIKVDREERPDVDAVYMTATQAMTGQGGWPMTVFMTADREPFYCGTYFPREPFQRLTRGVTQAWRDDRGSVVEQAKKISAVLSERADAGIRAFRDAGVTGIGDPALDLPAAGAGQDLAGPGAELARVCGEAVAGLADGFDSAAGGVGGAPKFPPWMVRELGTPEGGLAAALDADSEGEEGKFYVWTAAELAGVLGPDDGQFAAEAFGVTAAGTFERGRSVLQFRADPADGDRLARVRAALLAARESRVRPG